jgi:Protein of unknown function (DUF2442)
MILRVTECAVVGHHLLQLSFNDGTQKTVNLRPLLTGPIFEPLLDAAYFARGTLDRTCGTVVWPNGADFAPEALHDLKPVEGAILAS